MGSLEKKIVAVLVALLAVVVLSLLGCAGAPHSYTISNIEKVYLGSNGLVTLVIPSDGDTFVPADYSASGLSFKRDVPPGAKMWAQVTRETEAGRDLRVSSMTIHIHDLSDLNPGAWNHGKFGQGRMQGVE